MALRDRVLGVQEEKDALTVNVGKVLNPPSTRVWGSGAESASLNLLSKGELYLIGHA